MRLLRTRMENVTGLGALPFYAFIILFTYFVGDFVTSGRLFVALLISYVVGVSIRTLRFRERPVKENFSNLLERIDAASFPSMHSYRAAMLPVLFSPYGWDVTALFIVLAGLVMLSRHYLGKHRVHEIVVGAGLGLLTAAGVLAGF